MDQSETPSTSAVDAKLEQLAGVLEQKIEALHSALAFARNVRIGLIVIVVALVGVFSIQLFNFGRSLQSPAYIGDLRTRGEKRLAERQGMLTQELETLIKESSPVLTEAFYDQAKKDLPLFMTVVGNEREYLLNSLEKKYRTFLESRHDKLLEKYEAVIFEELPEAKDPEIRKKMMANLEKLSHKLVDKYYIHDLSENILQLYNAWDQFPVAAAPEANDPPMNDQLIAAMLDVLSVKLAHVRQELPPARASE